jgi:hypothetical protein
MTFMRLYVQIRTNMLPKSMQFVPSEIDVMPIAQPDETAALSFWRKAAGGSSNG